MDVPCAFLQFTRCACIRSHQGELYEWLFVLMWPCNELLQVVTLPSPYDSVKKLHHSARSAGGSGYRKWMDGFFLTKIFLKLLIETHYRHLNQL